MGGLRTFDELHVLNIGAWNAYQIFMEKRVGKHSITVKTKEMGSKWYRRIL